MLTDKDGNNPGNNDRKFSLAPSAPLQQDVTTVTAFSATKFATNEYYVIAVNACESNATVSANNDSIKPPSMHLISTEHLADYY